MHFYGAAHIKDNAYAQPLQWRKEKLYFMVSMQCSQKEETWKHAERVMRSDNWAKRETRSPEAQRKLLRARSAHKKRAEQEVSCPEQYRHRVCLKTNMQQHHTVKWAFPLPLSAYGCCHVLHARVPGFQHKPGMSCLTVPSDLFSLSSPLEILLSVFGELREYLFLFPVSSVGLFKVICHV